MSSIKLATTFEYDDSPAEEDHVNEDDHAPSRQHRNDGDNRTDSFHDPIIQLYRPANNPTQVEELFQRSDLSDNDILNFLSGSNLPEQASKNDDNDVRYQMRRAFHQRRSEVRELSKGLHSGEARVDDNGRLVSTDPPRPPNANLPPPPPPGRNHQEPNFLEPLLQADNVAAGNGLFGDGNIGEGINNGGGGAAAGANLTFRRICFAVLAVVMAFVCVILQTLPLMRPTESVDPNFDQLLHELLYVRFLKQYLRYCPDLDRQASSSQNSTDGRLRNLLSYRYWQEWMGFDSDTSCDDGVIHIPSKHILSNDYIHSAPQEASLLEPFRSGVDKIWYLPCHIPTDTTGSKGKDHISSKKSTMRSSCNPGWNNITDARTNATDRECLSADEESSTLSKCFRGVHDNVISNTEVDKALLLGNQLILNGADHFDIHHNVSYLHNSIPSVVTKLQRLLQDQYDQSGFQPVAFRIQTAGPMDLYGVNLFQSPALALNQTTYLEWVENCKRQNEIALYSLPWPFRVRPVRDTCNLMADLEADSRFAIHTSVFLSDGAGMEYRGGAILYADHHRSNYRPKHRIRRGLTIDGSKARVIASSGGIENRRCRMPTRAGLRIVLQIWWDRSSPE